MPLHSKEHCRRLAWLLGGLCLGSALLGCSHFPRMPFMGEDEPPDEVVLPAEATTDSTDVLIGPLPPEPAAADTVATPVDSTPEEAEVAPEEIADEVVPDPPVDATPAPTDTTTTAEDTPEIRLETTDEERAGLVAQIEEDIGIARAAIFAVGGSEGARSEDAERVATLEQYVRLAYESLESGDLRAASGLAQKARLLADRIHPR